MSMDLGVLRRWWPVAAVAGLLAAGRAGGRRTRRSESSRIPPAADTVPSCPSTRRPSPPPIDRRRAARRRRRPAPAHIPAWLGTVALGAARAGHPGRVVGLTWSGRWSAGRCAGRTRALPAQRPGAPPRAPPRRWSPPLDAGLVELDDRTTDPRTAVIACWVRLEEAAAAAGVPRQRRRHPDRPGHPAAARRPVGRRAGDRQRRRAGRASRTSTGRPGTPRTPSTTGCATRPGRRCAGCAPN